MFFVYVIQSQSSGRLYVGHTKDVTQRLGQHNSGITKSTKNRGPWEVVHREVFECKADAIRRERQLKTGRGRDELKLMVG